MSSHCDQGDARSPSNQLSKPDDPLSLVAYPVAEPLLDIVPASMSRPWMEATRDRYTERRVAMRCLPLLMANQSGWFLLNSHRFFVVWNGGDRPEDLKIVYLRGEPPYPAMSHFGYGVLTFNIPYLFRNCCGLQPAGPWPNECAEGRSVRVGGNHRDRLGGGHVHDELDDNKAEDPDRLRRT